MSFFIQLSNALIAADEIVAITKHSDQLIVKTKSQQGLVLTFSDRAQRDEAFNDAHDVLNMLAEKYNTKRN